MNRKDTIEDEIQKTLEYFDKAEKLAPNPYFYTRVQARLDEICQNGKDISAIFRPVLLTAILLINISTAVWYLSRTSQAEQTNSRQELVELLSNDFNSDLGQTDILNFEQEL